MKVSYYKKFSWCFLGLLIAGAAVLTLQTCSVDFSQQISLLGILPDWSKYIVVLFLISDIPVEYRARKNQNMSVLIRVWRYSAQILLLLVYIDRLMLGFVSRCLAVMAMDSNPESLLDSMLYMTINSHDIWLNGIIGTLELSLLGTVIGFLLAVLLVFMRVNTPDVRDKEAVQLLKLIGGTFEKIYVTVIRGTPMMVRQYVCGNGKIDFRAVRKARLQTISSCFDYKTSLG